MDNARPPTPTMGEPDTREHGMSLTQQPSPPDAPARPPRRGSERLAIAAAAVVTALAVAGIGALALNDDNPAAPTPTPSAAAPSSAPPSVAPAPQTPEDLAAAEATERYREFLRVEDVVGQGGYLSSEPYDAVTVPPERTDRQLLVTTSSAEGQRAIGDRELASLAVTSVDLTPEAGSYPTVILQACVDVSAVDVVDQTGASVVLPDRVDRTKSTVTMYRYEPGTAGAEAGGWYVYEATSRAEPC